MFKIKGIKKEVLKEEDRNGNVIDGITMNTDVKGHWGANGGKEAYADTTKAIYKFNEAHRSEGIAIKPFNMAEDGKNSNEWWINTLLVFNVDGRAYNRDKGTSDSPRICALTIKPWTMPMFWPRRFWNTLTFCLPFVPSPSLRTWSW